MLIDSFVSWFTQSPFLVFEQISNSINFSFIAFYWFDDVQLSVFLQRQPEKVHFAFHSLFPNQFSMFHCFSPPSHFYVFLYPPGFAAEKHFSFTILHNLFFTCSPALFAVFAVFIWKFINLCLFFRNFVLFFIPTTFVPLNFLSTNNSLGNSFHPFFHRSKIEICWNLLKREIRNY